MSAFDAVSAFVRQSNPNGIISTKAPKLDLDSYIFNYQGRTRYDRLIYIAKSSVPLCIDALKLAIDEARRGQDVSRFKDALDWLRTVAPDQAEALRGDAWIESTEKANKAETARLEAELKGYRNNLIKESIRMGNEDLGRHFERIGKLSAAAEAYSRMRQDVSTTKHIIDCGMHLANVSLQRRDWTMVLNNIGKINGIQNSDEDKTLQAYTKVVSGIALMGLGNFLDAARCFLQTDSSLASSEYNHVASPNDVAIYGGLLALATMDRVELQRAVLDNMSFRTFLEYEPHIRKAISSFVNGRYSNCLAILDAYSVDYNLDIYFQPHVGEIYERIRCKCIVQYFVPFSCVTLESLDKAFAPAGQSIIEELVQMIRNGSLLARVDAKNELLVAVQPDPRSEMQRNALEAVQRYEKDAKERLRRMSIIAAGLEVVGNKKHVTGQAGTPGLDEMGYEEPKNPPLQEQLQSQV